VEDPSVLVENLPGLLGASDVAAVLVRLAETDHRSMIRRAKALAPAVQTSDAASR
jgi:thiamine-phosphate pyrophosphorylase